MSRRVTEQLMLFMIVHVVHHIFCAVLYRCLHSLGGCPVKGATGARGQSTWQAGRQAGRQWGWHWGWVARPRDGAPG